MLCLCTGGRTLRVGSPGTGWMSPCRGDGGEAHGVGFEAPQTPAGPPGEELPDLQEAGHLSTNPCLPGFVPETRRGPRVAPTYRCLQLAKDRSFVVHTCQVLSAVGAFASEASHSLLSLAFPCRSCYLHSPGVCVSVSGGSYSGESPCCLQDTPRAEALFLAPRTALLTFNHF